MISKCLVVSSILPKNKRNQFDLRYHSSKVDFFCLFFGRIEDTKKTFQNNWPLLELSHISFLFNNWILLMWNLFIFLQALSGKQHHIHKSKYSSQKNCSSFLPLNIANISLYALSRPKLNFGWYVYDDVWNYIPENFASYLMQIARFDR